MMHISLKIWDEYNDLIERMTKKYPSKLKKQLIDEVFKLSKVIITEIKMMIFYHLEILTMSLYVHPQNS